MQIFSYADRDLYMRYLGGGVGHRENGVDVHTSKEHAQRWRRAGGYSWDPDESSKASSQDTRSSSDDDTNSTGADRAERDDLNPRQRSTSHDHGAHARQTRGRTRRSGEARVLEDEDEEDEADEDWADEDGADEDEANQGGEDEYAEEEEYAGEYDFAWEDEFAGEEEHAEQDEWGPDVDQEAAEGLPGGDDADQQYEDYYVDEIFAAEGFAPL